MKKVIWVKTILLILALSCTLRAGEENLTKGIDAYNRGDFKAAIELLRPLANERDGEALYYMGRMHEKGQGVEKDFIKAHVNYNLASQKNHALAREALNKLSAMMTREQISQAQEMAGGGGGTLPSIDPGDQAACEELLKFVSRIINGERPGVPSNVGDYTERCNDFMLNFGSLKGISTWVMFDKEFETYEITFFFENLASPNNLNSLLKNCIQLSVANFEFELLDEMLLVKDNRNNKSVLLEVSDKKAREFINGRYVEGIELRIRG